MNDLYLVGRLTQDVELRETPAGKQVAEITLAVRRDFKNSNGEYDTDFIPVQCWEFLASNIAEICKKGDLVIMKCRVQIRSNKVGEITIKVPEIIGETFMIAGSSNRSEA